MYSLGIDAAANVVDELEARPVGSGSTRSLTRAVLAAAARLLHVRVLGFGGLADRLAIRHLRLADIRRHAELAHHAVDDDFEVQFAHARENRLPGFRIGIHAERRVFLGQLLNRHAHLFLIGLGLRLDRQLNHRRREVDRLEHNRVVFVADRIAGDDGLQSHRRRRYRPPGFPGSLRACWRACAAGGRRAPCGPWRRCRPTRRRPACPNTRGRTRADPTYGSVMILNTSAANGSLSDALRVRIDVRIVDRSPSDRRNIEWRRQVVHHRVQHRLHALVLECRPADDRENLQRDGRFADAGANLVVRSASCPRRTSRTDDRRTRKPLRSSARDTLGFFQQVGGNLDVRSYSAPSVSSRHMTRFHLDQVHDALELILGAHRI